MLDITRLHKIKNLENQRCFACGDENPIGLHMSFHTDGSQLYSMLSVPETMAGWDRTAHGGILSTIMDEIMGWTVIYFLKKIGVTKSMQIEYLHPVQVGTPVTAQARILERKSKKTILVQGELLSGKDKLCVKATGEFVAITAPASVRLGIMTQEFQDRFLPIMQQGEEE